jgi:hypothetical protein
MKYLDAELPKMTLKIKEDANSFFSKFAKIGEELGMRPHRDYYIGGQQRLLLFKSSNEDSSFLRLFNLSGKNNLVNLDYVETRIRKNLDHELYLAECLPLYKSIIKQYNKENNFSIRIKVQKKQEIVDLLNVDQKKLHNAIYKLELAIRTLALHGGEMRKRLFDAFLEFNTIDPNALPKPLNKELALIYSKLSSKKEQFRGQGTLLATLNQIRNTTAVEIAERIYRLFEILKEIENRLENKNF